MPTHDLLERLRAREKEALLAATARMVGMDSITEADYRRIMRNILRKARVSSKEFREPCQRATP